MRLQRLRPGHLGPVRGRQRGGRHLHAGGRGQPGALQLLRQEEGREQLRHRGRQHRQGQHPRQYRRLGGRKHRYRRAPDARRPHRLPGRGREDPEPLQERSREPFRRHLTLPRFLLPHGPARRWRRSGQRGAAHLLPHLQRHEGTEP